MDSFPFAKFVDIHHLRPIDCPAGWKKVSIPNLPTRVFERDGYQVQVADIDHEEHGYTRVVCLSHLLWWPKSSDLIALADHFIDPGTTGLIEPSLIPRAANPNFKSRPFQSKYLFLLRFSHYVDKPNATREETLERARFLDEKHNPICYAESIDGFTLQVICREPPEGWLKITLPGAAASYSKNPYVLMWSEGIVRGKLRRHVSISRSDKRTPTEVELRQVLSQLGDHDIADVRVSLDNGDRPILEMDYTVPGAPLPIHLPRDERGDPKPSARWPRKPL